MSRRTALLLPLALGAAWCWMLQTDGAVGVPPGLHVRSGLAIAPGQAPSAPVTAAFCARVVAGLGSDAGGSAEAADSAAAGAFTAPSKPWHEVVLSARSGGVETGAQAGAQRGGMPGVASLLLA
ncbi:MAG: hypothetical protein H0V09_06030, partial [Gemmatimonadetes bacterium]|nr:hypothetical protein [Gemmatimonadota bacterium]